MLAARYAALEKTSGGIGDWSRLLGDVIKAYAAIQSEILTLRRLYPNPESAAVIDAARAELRQIIELRVRVMSMIAEVRASIEDKKRRRA